MLPQLGTIYAHHLASSPKAQTMPSWELLKYSGGVGLGATSYNVQFLILLTACLNVVNYTRSS